MKAEDKGSLVLLGTLQQRRHWIPVRAEDLRRVFVVAECPHGGQRLADELVAEGE